MRASPTASIRCRRRCCARSRTSPTRGKHGKPVALCGELASQPIGALALVALGYRSLSLSPSAVGPVKAMLLDLDAGKATALLEPLIDSPAGSVPIRERLEAFAARRAADLNKDASQLGRRRIHDP